MCLAYITLIAVVITFPYFLTRKTPPGYIIGGDTLVHAAISRGIHLGRNPFLDQTYNVYPNWYPFLYHLIIATISKAVGISIETTMILFQAVLVILMILTLFYVARGLWGSKAGTYAAALSLMMLTAHIYPNPKELAPLFGILSVYFMLKEMFIVSGILMGLALWTHYAFVIPLAGLPLVIGVIKREKRYLLVVLLAFLVFSPFIINVSLHSGGVPRIESIYNPWQTDTFENKLRSLLPPLYMLPFLGLAVLHWKYERESSVEALLLLVGIIAVARISPGLLEYFGIFIWSKRFTGMLGYVYLLLSAYGLSTLNLSGKKMTAIVTVTMMVLTPIAGALVFWNTVTNDKFIRPSNHDFSQYFPREHFPEISSWVLNHTERDDVIATSEEAGMMLNALTGRPIVATLYGHGNTFIDNQKRRDDLEQLFTGNCSKKREIIEEYHVRVIITEPFVYEHWNVTDMRCVAIPAYWIEDVTVWEVKK
ncbi:glycosyltransferase family 39 protein [Thermococcus sp. MAR1]|uniref:glycosyltransferase family 39 protein n=1 Tax=Thermococcus sp. MAR1 TaxID=1638263 RepID=UPI0019800820